MLSIVVSFQRGPNKVPVYAMGVVASVTIAFIVVGDINTLAPIVTMPFLLTYACIDYSYFALAQTFDIVTRREERFRIQAQSPSYESRRYGSTNDNDNDLDHLFPERTRHKLATSIAQSDRKVPSKNPLLPSQSDASAATSAAGAAHIGNDSIDAEHPDRVTFRGGVDANGRDASINSSNVEQNEDGAQLVGNVEDDDEPMALPIAPIYQKTKNWYSNAANRWASLLGALVKIVIMMLVNAYYGATCIGVVFLVWFYVGTANPAVKPGLAAEFRLFVWLKGLVFRCFG